MGVKHKILNSLVNIIEIVSAQQSYYTTKDKIRTFSYWRFILALIQIIIYLQFIILLPAYYAQMTYKQPTYMLSQMLNAYLGFMLVSMTISYVLGFLNFKSLARLDNSIVRVYQDLSKLNENLTFEKINNDYSPEQQVLIFIFITSILFDLFMGMLNFRSIMNFLKVLWILFCTFIPHKINICNQFCVSSWFHALQPIYEIINQLLSKYLISKKQNFRLDLIEYIKVIRIITNIFQRANNILSWHFLIIMSLHYFNLMGNAYLILCHFLFDQESGMTGYYFLAIENCLTSIILLWLMSKQTRKLQLEVSILIVSYFYNT